MNLKDFKSVTAVLPLHYPGEHNATMANAVVKVDRDNQIVITIPGAKHANAFIDLILSQSVTGFITDVQAPKKGFPGDNVEVSMGPSSKADPEEEIPITELCVNHVPLQHRDGKEPWCRRCGLTKDFYAPRTIQFGNRPPQVLQESFRKYQEGDTVAGP